MSNDILYIIQYAEISLIAVAILSIVFYALEQQKSKRTSTADKVLKKLIIVNVLVLLSDVVILLLRNQTSPIIIFLNHIVCIIYFILQQVFSLLWLVYVIKRIYPNDRIKNKKNILIIIPSILSILLIISSPFTGIVYSLNSSNIYSRGDLMVVMLALNYIYYLAAIFIIIKNMVTKKHMKEASPYFSLIMFCIPTIIGNIIQIKLYGITLTWIVAALSILLLYINIQLEKIYKDQLTNLFNRNYINKHIEWLIENKNKTDKTFVIMSDLDHFKNINDNYGHLEGDKALITIADILRRTCPSKMTVSRFAGDEFLITGTIKEENELLQLLTDIHKELDRINKSKKEKYKLSISMGYSIFDEETNSTLDDLVFYADENMYKEKAKKKRKA